MQVLQQAAINLAGRVADGVSTGLVVWAGRPTCPHCECDCTPVLQCPSLTCSTGDVAHASPLNPFALGLAVICVACVSFSIGRLTGVKAKFTADAEELDATARAQVAQYRSGFFNRSTYGPLTQ